MWIRVVVIEVSRLGGMLAQIFFFFFNGYKIYSDIVKVKEGSRVQKASGQNSRDKR